MAKRVLGDATSVLVVYRLVGSPVLRDEHRSAKVLGALARMESGPVSAAWFARRTGLTPAAALELLDDICNQGCARRIEVPWMACESQADEPSRTTWFDLFEISGANPQPRAPLRRVYQFLRRTFR